MNTAQKILIPQKPGIFRITFLYVGQGDATLLTIPDGVDYLFALVDHSKDAGAGGIDVIRMLEDLLPDRKLDFFINTHPHDDHTEDLWELHERVQIHNVWHAGHELDRDESEAYDNLVRVIEDIEGKEYLLYGSRSRNILRKENFWGVPKRREVQLGDIDYQVFSPADYVVEDIEEDDLDSRRKRIHEQCGVIKFMYGPDHNEKSILITGDSDKTAWERIMYHEDDLPSTVLRSSHHGSYTFFKDRKNDRPFKDHLDAIDPEAIIVSAPKRHESKYKHPHESAMRLYREQVDSENVYHLGKDRSCVVVNIYPNGKRYIRKDHKLVEEYGF